MSLTSYATDAINKALKAHADYADVRVEHSYAHQIGTRNNNICGVNVNLQKIIGVRVLYKNCWGFASSSSLDNSSINRLVENAIASTKNIMEKNTKDEIKLANTPKRKTSVSDECQKKPQFLEQNLRIDLLKDINNRIYSRVENMSLLDIKLTETHTQKIFMNSEGSEIEQILIRAGMFLGSSMRGTSNQQKVRSVGFGGVGGIEQFECSSFDDFLIAFIESLPKIAHSKLIRPIEQPVILNEEMSWNLCHEFCHSVEGDLILVELSPLKNQIGTKIGSEYVTIVDDASFKGFGEYYFDDEGVKASGTLIVEDGILVDFLHNRETAGQSNVIPTSNGRAESALYYPQVRQSNTFFEPGNYTFEELLEKVRTGLYICDSSGGNADIVHGNFQLDAQYGRKIEKGELGDYVTNFSMIGNLYTTLGDIHGVTNEISSFPAYCGKNGQRIRVGAISPKIGLKRMTIISNIAQKQIKKIDFNAMGRRI